MTGDWSHHKLEMESIRAWVPSYFLGAPLLSSNSPKLSSSIDRQPYGSQRKAIIITLSSTLTTQMSVSTVES